MEQRIKELEAKALESKLAEEALQTERNNLRNIFDSIEDGIYIVNQQYDIQYVNPVLVKDFGPYEGIKCCRYFHDMDEVCPWCKNQDVWARKTVSEHILSLEDSFVLRVLYQVDLNTGMPRIKKMKKAYFSDPFILWTFRGWTEGWLMFYEKSCEKVRDELFKSCLAEMLVANAFFQAIPEHGLERNKYHVL